MTEAKVAPDQAAVPVTDDAPKPIRRELVDAYSAMIADVPESGGDGMEGILLALSQATDVADLDAPWRTAGLDDYLNQRLRVIAIRKVPSEYDGGLPWFLVMDAAVVGSGELVTITTGAVSVVAQLVKAWALGAFPLTVIPRQADRPSRAGFYPQHLEIVA